MNSGNNSDNLTIVVGMSGGVDSSVTALLLKQQGYNVIGLFMKNWEEDDDSEYCSAEVDVNDAERVCQTLGIPLHTVNFANQYWDNVFEYFLAEYRRGRTPNPDVLCNREIKFKVFLDYARNELGADLIATGHYARKRATEHGFELLRALDNTKDQTYFLYMLNQAQLMPALFPLGELTKLEVRKLAEQHGLVTHDKKDSTGICFIGERKFKQFLNEYLPAKPGKIVDEHGNVLGQHDGLMFYTIGQRQGLGIGGRHASSGEPWYVIDKDLDHNRLIVGQGNNHPALFKSTLQFEQAHWVAGRDPEMPLRCQAKVRYSQTTADCIIQALDSGLYQADFTELQRAPTPGQSIVLYQDKICLGGGIIC